MIVTNERYAYSKRLDTENYCTSLSFSLRRYDLEFHMVHFKKSLKTRQEAMFEPDGLAVCSFLIKVSLRVLTARKTSRS